MPDTTTYHGFCATWATVFLYVCCLCGIMNNVQQAFLLKMRQKCKTNYVIWRVRDRNTIERCKVQLRHYNVIIQHRIKFWLQLPTYGCLMRAIQRMIVVTLEYPLRCWFCCSNASSCSSFTDLYNSATRNYQQNYSVEQCQKWTKIKHITTALSPPQDVHH